MKINKLNDSRKKVDKSHDFGLWRIIHIMLKMEWLGQVLKLKVQCEFVFVVYGGEQGIEFEIFGH